MTIKFFLELSGFVVSEDSFRLSCHVHYSCYHYFYLLLLVLECGLIWFGPSEGPLELASSGVSVSVFNIISKLFNIPLLSITTSFVAEDISKSALKKFASGA